MLRVILALCCGLTLAVGFLILKWVTLEEKQDEAPAPALLETASHVERRSFTGAPPTIPHHVSRSDNSECIYCHSSVRETFNGVSNITPHPQYTNCQQCHVGTQLFNKDLPVPKVANSFVGWKGETEGFRAHELAPPTVPHTLFLRENCNSCHSPDNPEGRPRGPHPYRTNCRQCHVQQNPEF